MTADVSKEPQIIGHGVELQPIDSIDALLEWDAKNVDKNLISETPLSLRQSNGPKTMVCHDMANGYKGDRFSSGYNFTGTPFYISHWPYIDVFNYFSHHHITIPPKCWIDVAHKHGTAVIGTFITEWTEGAEICARIFTDRAVLLKVVDQLANIALCYGFDGWLINLENSVPFEQLSTMIEFVDLLTKECRQVLGAERSHVIWYDSVIASSGRLKWQDELNALNLPMFNVSDGILLNYTWTEGSLHQNMIAAKAEDRHKVYIGLDIWGRNCEWYGGFKIDCGLSKINKICANAMSFGLFAIAWLYESLPLDEYVENSHKFWRIASPHLNKCHKIRLTDLPLSTAFQCGVIDNTIDMSNQEMCAHLLCQSKDTAEGENILTAHYRRGLCLDNYRSGSVIRLFCCDVPSTNLTISISIRLPLSCSAPSGGIVVDYTNGTSTDHATRGERSNLEHVEDSMGRRVVLTYQPVVERMITSVSFLLDFDKDIIKETLVVEHFQMKML